MKKPSLRLVREALVELDVVELESVNGAQSGWLCITRSQFCITKTFGCVQTVACE